MVYRYLLFSFVFFCLLVETEAQISSDTTRFKKVAAGADYGRKSSFYQRFWGTNRRAEWSTLVNVPILIIDTAFGGMKIYEKGGGNETRSLRLRSTSGKEYALRSINKSRAEVIPPEFKGTFVEGIIKDGVSMSYPYGAFAVAEMMQAAGIYHTLPQLVYIPKQPALDSLNEKFGNDLYLIEQRPDGDWSEADNLGNFKKYKSTEKVIEEILDDNRKQVDQFAFAKGRLFDFLINDWDRHEDNWRWGVKDSAGHDLYVPVPRDRDQAFYTYNGWLTGKALAASDLGFMQNFDYKIKDVRMLNWEERNFDRFFTNELSLHDWLKAAEHLQTALTDEVIERSVKALPAEIYAVSGKELTEKLKVRRNDLHIYAEDYYRFIAAEADVTGSKRKDFFEISRTDSGTSVTVYSLNDNGIRRETPVFKRHFDDATKEIRLYGIDGSDVFQINGTADGHLLRIIGGEEKDSIVQTGGNHVHIYDNNNNIFSVKDARLHLSEDTTVHEYSYRSYNYSSKRIMPVVFFNRDDLWYVGLNYSFLKYKWRRDPYASKGTIGVNYYGARRAISVTGSLLFPKLIGRWDATVAAEYDAVNWTNYVGLGNETKLMASDLSFHRTRSKDWTIAFGVSKKIGGGQLQFALTGERVKLLHDTSKFISKAGLNTNAFEAFHYGGLEMRYNYANVNDSLVPTKGIAFTGRAGLIRNFTEPDTYQNYFGKVNLYVPIGGKFSLALRAGSQLIAGSDSVSRNARINQYATIGGALSLRGYWSERFWGKSSFFNQNEFRFITNVRTRLLNAKAGVMAFFDNGRVWLPGENSNTMHTSYGGGVIIAPFNKISLTVTYGVSSEAKLLQVNVNTLF